MSVVVLVTATDAGSKANPRADAGSGAISVNKTTSVMARATATCQNWRLCFVARALVQKAIALIYTPLPLVTSCVDGEASFTEFSRAGFERRLIMFTNSGFPTARVGAANVDQIQHVDEADI